MPGLTFGIYDEAGGVCGIGAWHVIESGVEPAPGVWHHVAAVLDETSGMMLYLDGVPIGASPSTATYVGAGEGTSTIGHMHEETYDGYWPSKLDDIGLFGYALTPPEVAWLATHSLADLPPRAYDPFCIGDGSGTACPCGNESAAPEQTGCENSTGQGGALRAAGSAAVGADTLTLAAYGLPASTSGVFIQGTGQAGGGAGTVFGDGLLCVEGSVVRIAGVSASGGVALYPQSGDPAVSVRGALPPGGGTRHYQYWYRNQVAAFCPSAPFNLTNGVEVVWLP
jgi:hypothetical protein